MRDTLCGLLCCAEFLNLGTRVTLGFSYRVSSISVKNKNYQQMRLFVLCLYFHFLVFSLHVSGFHKPIIRGISSCYFCATIWFMQCFVDHLCASADADAHRWSTKHCM